MAFERPGTAQEAVLVELRRAIASGRWQPGEPIRQEALAAEFGVSRVPVREALKILEGEGQIQYRAHHGYVAATFDDEELRELFLIRELLEREAIRHGVARMTAERLEEMHAAMEAMERLDPRDPVQLAQLSELNRTFHFAIFQAARMPRLLHFIRVLWDASAAYRAKHYADLGADWWQQVLQEHRAMYEACAMGEVDRTLEVYDHHRGRGRASSGLDAMGSDRPSSELVAAVPDAAATTETEEAT